MYNVYMTLLPAYLRKLRNQFGYSQEQIAQELDVSRPTYLLIEKGDRELTISEAQKLAALFGMSLEDLLQGQNPKEILINLPKDATESESDMRISIPEENLSKFREVLLYILNKVGARPNVGETVLYKLLYFIDFDYYEKFEKQLIGARYIKNKFGPTPVAFAKVVEEMEKKGELTRVKSKYFTFEQKKYLPLRSANLNLLSAEDKQHIDEVLHRYAGKTANELSELSHRDIPWKVHKMGEQLDYEYALYREPPFSAKSHDNDPI